MASTPFAGVSGGACRWADSNSAGPLSVMWRGARRLPSWANMAVESKCRHGLQPRGVWTRQALPRCRPLRAAPSHNSEGAGGSRPQRPKRLLRSAVASVSYASRSHTWVRLLGKDIARTDNSSDTDIVRIGAPSFSHRGSRLRVSFPIDGLNFPELWFDVDSAFESFWTILAMRPSWPC